MAKTQEIRFEEEIPSSKSYSKSFEWSNLGLYEKGYVTDWYRRVAAQKQFAEFKDYGAQEGVYIISFNAPEPKGGNAFAFNEEDSMRPFEDAISSSHKILDIEDDWDSDGSPGYSERTWQRATSFVRNIARSFLNTSATASIEPPSISPGPDGSIDVRWVSAKRTVLINFPADENAPADFFGHNKGQESIKGTLHLASQNHWLLLWLTR